MCYLLACSRSQELLVHRSFPVTVIYLIRNGQWHCRRPAVDSLGSKNSRLRKNPSRVVYP